MDLQEIARKLDVELVLHRREAFTDQRELDVQALCVAEEAGELLEAVLDAVEVTRAAGRLTGAYRRYSGAARRTGTIREVADEIADVLIVTAGLAHRLGIDIDAAVQDKLRVIYARGWKEQA